MFRLHPDSDKSTVLVKVSTLQTYSRRFCLLDDGRAVDVRLQAITNSSEMSEWSEISTFYCTKKTPSEDIREQKPLMKAHKKGYHNRKLNHSCFIDANLYSDLNTAVPKSVGTSQVFQATFSSSNLGSGCGGASIILNILLRCLIC